jgi:V8-like Glu-specific endopeptidase
MPWSQTMVQLKDILADLYSTNADALRVARDAGLRVASIEQSQRPLTTWSSIVVEADHHGKLESLVATAIHDYPAHPFLIRAQHGGLSDVRGPTIDWAPGAMQPERIIGINSLLPVSFLAGGLRCSRSVGRLVHSDGSSGSGFLIGDNVVVTNHHVIESAAAARDTTLEMNYQHDELGSDEPVDRYALDPDSGFATSKDDDWTLVRARGTPCDRWGRLAIDVPSIAVGDRVNIIQHPGGGPKQLAIHGNAVTFASDSRLQYLTDTMPGSSGSPVFDRQWRVVAVHHSGGWMREPDTGQHTYRNEGIPLAIIVRAGRGAGLLR